MTKVLHAGVTSRHIILTVPAMCRTTFYHHAGLLLSALMRCGVQCLDDFYSEARGKTLKGGSIAVLHPHGRNGQYHPHLHLLATRGGDDESGVWRIWHPTYGVIYDEAKVIKRGMYESIAQRSGP